MEHLDEEQIRAIILCVDFETAFDSLEWLFIEEALQAFNFGPSILQWIQALYNNTNSSS